MRMTRRACFGFPLLAVVAPEPEPELDWGLSPAQWAAANHFPHYWLDEDGTATIWKDRAVGPARTTFDFEEWAHANRHAIAKLGAALGVHPDSIKRNALEIQRARHARRPS